MDSRGSKAEVLRKKSDFVCELPGMSNMYCLTISPLEKRRVYVIKVYAINAKGMGPEAYEEEETDEAIPDAPEMVNVTERTMYFATVVWSLPLRQNGKIKGYQVNVTTVIGNDVILSRNLTEMTIFIQGLAPATYYNVYVAASTSKGYGPSAEITFSTRSPTLTIDETPTLGAVMDNTVVLVIKPVNLQSIPMSAYFVIVKEVLENEKDSEKERRRKRRCTYDLKQGKRRRRCSGVPGDSDDGKGSTTQDSFPKDYNTSRALNLPEYVAGKLQPQEVPPEGYHFQVGDGRTYNGYYNAPLATGHKYQFGMGIVSEYPEDPKVCVSFLKDTVTVRSPEEPATATSVGLVVGLVIICLLAIIAFLLFLYYKKPRLFHTVKDKASNSFHIMNNNKEGGPRSTLTESSYSLELRSHSSQMKGNHSNRVPVAELDRFVREGIESEQIEQEFKSVSKGQLHSIDVARLSENKSKNRYGNLLPYDHSRVVLDKVNNDEFSDYINACYVDGYKGSRKYIATQGPKPVTLNDFWRMVWQLDVCKIAMVTNALENGKVKCEKYWPDTTDRYGQFTIEHKEVNTFSDFVIRTFQISKGENESKEVVQFHFTTWADHQVPMYPMAMGGFLKRLRAYRPESNAPVVVHCSAGVGRTGTLILVDSMMDMAAAENTVDVYSQFWSMRQQRINLVENQDQYVFAYQTLAEVLSGVDSSIVCSDFYNEYTRLKKEDPNTGKSPMAAQFEVLETRRHPLKSTDCKNALDPSNTNKNRDSSIVPPDRSRPVLPVFQPEITSNYVNAVYVNGYKQRDQFVATQMPLPHTVSDFWRMLKSTRTRTIVLLQDGEMEQYWPHENPVEHGALKVTTTSTEKEGNVIVRQFTIKGPGPKDEVTIKQFHFQNWKTNQDVPSSADMFLDLIERVERWQKQAGNKPVIVQCLNGASACGVYCATVFVCDKIKSDQEVDVFLAVRSIRNNRPQLITSQEQYMFCYLMAITFLDAFETYANFQ